MTTPKLSAQDYNALIDDWNRRVRRGVIEPCVNHEWARIPQDAEDDPHMICIHCLRNYRPQRGAGMTDPRRGGPPNGFGSGPI